MSSHRRGPVRNRLERGTAIGGEAQERGAAVTWGLRNLDRCR
jgi:hypothetical protein